MKVETITLSILCIFVLLVANGFCLYEISYTKAILKTADKLSKAASTIQTMGTVTEIGSTGIDITIDYAVYAFQADNGEIFSGRFYIQEAKTYQIGDGVTINYNRENPEENVCIDRLVCEKKDFNVALCAMLFGNLFVIGIFLVSFLINR